MLGYGGTDKPGDIPDYGLKSLSNDIAALLDLLQVRKAIVAGHDWGAATVWRFALYFPERVLGLVWYVSNTHRASMLLRCKWTS